MEPEIKKLLVESIEISKENNQLLQKLVNAQKRANIYRIVYWGIIILSTFGAYYFIQPLLGNLLNVYTGGVSSGTNVGDIFKNLNDKKQTQDLINTINAIK